MHSTSEEVNIFRFLSVAFEMMMLEAYPGRRVKLAIRTRRLELGRRQSSELTDCAVVFSVYT